MTKPLCECHGKPMYWRKDKRRPNGGYFACYETHLQDSRRWKKNNPQIMRRSRARRIIIGAGGMRFYLGCAPTVEAANYLRKKIKEEAPK